MWDFVFGRMSQMHPNAIVAWDRDVAWRGMCMDLVDVRVWITGLWWDDDDQRRMDGLGSVCNTHFGPWRAVCVEDEDNELGVRWYFEQMTFQRAANFSSTPQ